MNYIPELKEIPVCVTYVTFSPYVRDITLRKNNYNSIWIGPQYTDMYTYTSTAKFPKWRNKSNGKV